MIAVHRREEFPLLMNELKLFGVGVEGGTNEGEFSELLLRDSGLSLLYSVDSWADLSKTRYADPKNHTYVEHQQHRLAAIRRLTPFGSRSKILHMFSSQASALFEDGTLDFAYIDAHHSYRSCREDLSLWYPKVRRGGLLAGHDYVEDGLWNVGCVFGVKKAVDEFVAERNHALRTTEETNWKSWYLIKEEL